MELIPPENARSDVARSLVLAEVFGTPYSETPLYALERALAGGSSEFRIAEVERDGRIAALALFGAFAGTVGTARMFLIAPTNADAHSLAAEVCAAAMSALHAEGTRLVIAELPDDPCVDGMRKLLLESGFHEESRVDDLIRDGVALTFLRREL